MAVKNTGRIDSLDIFRGITIAFMIIVNTPGSWLHVYPPLRHSEWEGCTLTDMVFPFFIFISGVSLWYSMKKYDHEINGGSLLRIFRRVVAIFILGLFLNIFPHFGMDYSALRIMGVLQRIALVYLVGAIICLTIRKEHLWIVFAVLLLVYWGLLAFFGGDDPYSLTDNVLLKIDSRLLGDGHLYRGFGIPFDPEGLPGTIPAICTMIAGYYAGEIIGNAQGGAKAVLKMVLLGISAVGAGILWGEFFPINKPLWTSSYVLYTAGFAYLILALLYLVVDVWKLKLWGIFFTVFGTNAIFSYFTASIWSKTISWIKIPSDDSAVNLYSWLYDKVFAPLAGDLNGSLIFALVQMLVIWLFALILFRKKVFIRL